jgi:pheromone shutdown protein TraB
MVNMNILLFIVFVIVFLITNVYENYFRDKENHLRSMSMIPDADKAGKFWHRAQWLNWAVAIIFTVYLCFDFSFLAGALVLLICADWWILYDGALNSLKKRYFFFLSTTTTNEFEAFGNIYVKLLFLAITIVLLWIAL